MFLWTNIVLFKKLYDIITCTNNLSTGHERHWFELGPKQDSQLISQVIHALSSSIDLNKNYLYQEYTTNTCFFTSSIGVRWAKVKKY